MKKLLIPFLILVSLGVTATAQTHWDYVFDHYSTETGLPHNSICDIHQDSNGYIWVCTWFGLSRFDGVRFVNYTAMPENFSIGIHNRMLSVHEDVNGFLWLQTYDHRICRFDPQSEKFVAIPEGLEQFQGTDFKITAFHTDAAGNAWVALLDRGLYRISPDLKAHQIIKKGVDLIGREISNIYEDSDGVIYIVSEQGIVLIRKNTPELLSRDENIFDFCEREGKVYISVGTDVIALEKATSNIQRIQTAKLGLGNVTQISVSADQIYFGFSKSAIATLNPETNELKVKKGDLGRVRYLFPDEQGMVWIGTDRTGIYSYNPEKDKFKHYEHPRNTASYYSDTLACVEQKAGITWIKMNNYGFGHYDRERDEIIPLYNIQEQPNCRFQNGVACFEYDSDGVLWMSTVGRGLERVNLITPTVDVIIPSQVTSDVLAASEIRAIRQDSKGNIWIADKVGELFRYNSDLTEKEKIWSAKDSRGIIYTIFEDKDGTMWFGTKGEGLYKMLSSEKGKYTFKNYRHDPRDNYSICSDNIYSIDQDKDGKIWIGTFGGGLSMLQTPDSEDFISSYNRLTSYPIDHGERVRFVHILNDGKMLVSTVGGLFLADPCANIDAIRFKTLNDASFPNRDIVHMFSDSLGCTYLSSFGGGVLKIKVDEGKIAECEQISLNKGLASSIVFSSILDKYGDLWIATDTGISKYSPSADVVTNYSRYDGVVPTTFSEATCQDLTDGTILFGSLNNIYRVHPDFFREVIGQSRLTIQGVTVDGERHPIGDNTIVIPAAYSYFRIDYASLNFGIKGSLNYSYRLKGHDKDWILNAGAQSVTYSHVRPGTYTFMVSVSSRDGIAVDQTAQVKIKILSPLLLSWPFRLLYFAIVALVIFLIARARIISQQLTNKVNVAKELNDEKIRFFTNISHEFRTPLTLILGGIEQLEGSTRPGSRNEFAVKLVARNARRMLMLVNQLLDIRSIANKSLRLKTEQFDIVELVNEVFKDFYDMGTEREIEMRTTLSTNSLFICADKMRIECLIYNLISNAFKYTPDKGVIEVAVRHRQGENSFTLIVKDNGIGIDPEKIDKIFEPFVREAESVNGMESSGIGLSFCKEIVQMHEGTITCKSSVGKGAEFRIIMPVDRDHFFNEAVQFLEANELTEQLDKPDGLQRYRIEGHPHKGAPSVLIVEDNAELRIYMYNCLCNKFIVKDVADGAEALAIMQGAWAPDIIITDLMMPNMNGMELIEKVRNNFSLSHIPIIVFTAKHEVDTHLKAVKYGADAYIAKPVSMKLMIAKIDSLLDARRRYVNNMAASGPHFNHNRVTFTPEEVIVTDRDEQFIKKVQEWLEANVAESEVTVEQLADHVNMGRTTMYNKIKGLTGKSPVELINAFRLEKAALYLNSGQYSVSEISYKVGFSDPGYFSRSFKKYYGISPVDYIKSHKRAAELEEPIENQ